MKRLFISLAFFALLAMASTPMRAQTFQQDTTGASAEGTTDFNNAIDNFATQILDWITGTVWNDIESLVTGIFSDFTSGISSVGSDISSGWNDFTSLFSAHHGRRSNASILAAPADSSVIVSNGIFTTGSLIGTSVDLWNDTSQNLHGATIVDYPTLSQNTVYTIPDPHSATASFVLDHGDQMQNGNQTFGGNVTINNLTASEAVVTDPSKKLVSLVYGSSNTASTLVERDGSGNFSAGTITTGTTSTGHIIATSSGTAAVSSNAVSVSDNPVFIITGTSTATIALTMPASPATGDVILVINQSTNPAQNGSAAETVPAGGSRSFYYSGSWQ